VSLENIYYIGQTVAVAAILGSLIVLILQVHHANKQAAAENLAQRKRTMYQQINSLQEMTRTIYETPGLAEILLAGNHGLGRLQDGDRLRYITYCTTIYRIWENLHAQLESGQVDQALWDIHANELRNQLGFVGAREVWTFRKPMFSQAFQDYVATLDLPSAQGRLHDISPAQAAAQDQAPD